MASHGAAQPDLGVDWDICLHTLEAGVRALRLGLPAVACATMIEYLRHLQAWNRSHNLTAVRHPQDMVLRHLLDSLAALPYVHGTRVADVGSGAGLPGIPIALARPGWAVTLIEANGRKAAFLRHVAHALRLDNVFVAHNRVADFSAPEGFDTLLFRAFSSSAECLRSCGHLCARGARVVLFKGRDPVGELEGLPSGFQVEGVVRLCVPGLDAERHVVIVMKDLA